MFVTKIGYLYDLTKVKIIRLKISQICGNILINNCCSFNKSNVFLFFIFEIALFLLLSIEYIGHWNLMSIG